jgi:uncharacterized protein
MASVPDLIQTIHQQYQLPWFGLHGVTHWARVYENGLRLAPLTGADEQVLLLFALFHDSRRTNEGWDGGHGRRGAEYAANLRGDGFLLAPGAFDLLFYACAFHTDGLIDADPTVQTCWDADRLDLPRAGIRPAADRLCTTAARDAATIAWAADRSLRRAQPALLDQDWAVAGVDAPHERMP